MRSLSTVFLVAGFLQLSKTSVLSLLASEWLGAVNDVLNCSFISSLSYVVDHTSGTLHLKRDNNLMTTIYHAVYRTHDAGSYGGAILRRSDVTGRSLVHESM